MIDLVKCELLKLKRQKIILISLIITIIPILLGMYNFKVCYDIIKGNGTSTDWLIAWTQVGVFYVPIILPIMASVCCAMIFRVEYSNKNMKILLSTPTSRKKIYISKIITCTLVVLFIQVIFGILYFISGKILGITDTFPIVKISKLLLIGWLGILPLIAIQVSLSLKYEEFTKPIAIASICSILGFVLGAVKYVKFIWPWALQRIAMDPIGGIGIEGIISKVIYITYCLVFAGIIIKVGINKFEKMEIN